MNAGAPLSRERVVLDVEMRLARAVEILARLVEADVPLHRVLGLLVVERPRVVRDDVRLVALEERGAVYARLLAGRGRSGARSGARVGDGEAERGERAGGEGDEAGRGQELHGSPPWVAYLSAAPFSTIPERGAHGGRLSGAPPGGASLGRVRLVRGALSLRGVSASDMNRSCAHGLGSAPRSRPGVRRRIVGGERIRASTWEGWRNSPTRGVCEARRG